MKKNECHFSLHGTGVMSLSFCRFISYYYNSSHNKMSLIRSMRREKRYAVIIIK